MFPQRNDGTEKCQPHHQPAGQLFRHGDAGVEGVAEHDIAEHQHNHEGETGGYDAFQSSTVEVDELCHRGPMRRRLGAAKTAR